MRGNPVGRRRDLRPQWYTDASGHFARFSYGGSPHSGWAQLTAILSSPSLSAGRRARYEAELRQAIRDGVPGLSEDTASPAPSGEGGRTAQETPSATVQPPSMPQPRPDAGPRQEPADACGCPVPAEANLDQNINGTYNNGFVWWVNQVRPRGDQDYKNTVGGQYEPFGNFNFGATAAALDIPEVVAESAAGFVQYITHLPEVLQGDFSFGGSAGIPFVQAPYGDTPEDYAQVSAGYAFYEANVGAPENYGVPSYGETYTESYSEPSSGSADVGGGGASYVM